MYKFAKDNLIRGWPVKLNVPRDGGGHDEHTIHVDYMPLTKSQQRELIRNADAGDEGTVRGLLDPERLAAYDGIIADHVKGWDLADEQGEPLDFNRGNLMAVLDAPYLGNAIDRGLWEVSREAPSGNSGSGPGGSTRGRRS